MAHMKMENVQDVKMEEETVPGDIPQGPSMDEMTDPKRLLMNKLQDVCTRFGGPCQYLLQKYPTVENKADFAIKLKNFLAPAVGYHTCPKQQGKPVPSPLDAGIQPG